MMHSAYLVRSVCLCLALLAACSRLAAADSGNGYVKASGLDVAGEVSLSPDLTNAIAIGAYDFITYAVVRGPALRTRPASVSTLAGSNILLQASAEARDPFIYQWRRNDQSVDGATNAALIMDPVLPAHADDIPEISIISHLAYERDTAHEDIWEVALTGPTTNVVTVSFETIDVTARAGTDYVTARGEIVFPPGGTREQISVTILGNLVRDPAREFIIRLSSPTNATLAGSDWPQSIADDDTLSLPPFFAMDILARDLIDPTAMEFSPDGRLFVCEQGGRLRVIKNGELLASPFLEIGADLLSGWEAGLLGIAFDPDFQSNQFVYVYYTSAAPVLRNRVSRFTADGDVVLPGSEQVIFELDSLNYAYTHNGGALHFGPDGKLYVGVGENGVGANAQSLTNALGKILRLNPDGSIPSDNPFYDLATETGRAIWAYGLRNPFSFAFQPGSGRLLINDVGQSDWEEINEGQGGGNYGWPEAEGLSGAVGEPSFLKPVYSYDHTKDSGGCAIVGAAFYNPEHARFPQEYVGNYFFADYCSGWIRRLKTNNVQADFALGLGRPIDLRIGPDGSLYCLSFPFERESTDVYRIYYQGRRIEWLRHDGNQVQLLVLGGAGDFVLEASADLEQWQSVSTNHTAGVESYVFDVDPPGQPQRFYRLRESGH